MFNLHVRYAQHVVNQICKLYTLLHFETNIFQLHISGVFEFESLIAAA